MSDGPRLIDRSALAAYRTRARAFFLHEQARVDVEDRLGLVNRQFTDAAVVTPFPDVWSDFAAILVSDDDILALEPQSHDLVVHALCLHWSNDPVGQLIQCRRALRADGLFLAITAGGQTLHELRAALAQAEIEQSGGLSPRVLPMGEIRDLGALLQRAGFALPVADSFVTTISYQSPMHLMRDLRAMGESNAIETRLRHATRRSVLERAAELYPRDEDGRITATFEFVTLTGWAPSELQPRPLRPGSASARLADALGTKETKLRD